MIGVIAAREPRPDRGSKGRPLVLKVLDLVEAAKQQRWVRRSGIAQALGLFAMGRLNSLGVQTWGTKSFEFWTLLMAALSVARPRSVVELGSGRSTSFLAEYAMKERVPFVSAEQSRGFVRRVRRGLKAGFVDDRFVHRVPVGPSGWYEVEVLDRLVTFPCECLFIDGPVGAQERLGPASRDSEVARAWLIKAAPTLRLLIVDDVHRPENYELLESLLHPTELRSLFLSYRPGLAGENIVAISIDSASLERLTDACAAMGIAARRELCEDDGERDRHVSDPTIPPGWTLPVHR